MERKWPNEHLFGAYILLSLAFVIVNLVTIDNLPSWIDEVMMLDTSYNAAVHGSWSTTAWYRVVGQYPFSTYPPLYQMLATGWISQFGFSLEVVRGLNLLITFALGGVCLRLMTRYSMKLTLWTVALFTTLLWCTNEMAWMYRNGRPDMLCALMSVLTVYSIANYLSESTHINRFAVIITSALLLSSGIQAAVFLIILWLFCFVVIKDCRWQAVRVLVLLLTGYTVGLIAVAVFMAAHGYLIGFASSIVQYSATLSRIALAVLPWAGDVFGFSPAQYIQKLQELTTESSLSERIASVVEYRSFIILGLVALSAYAVSYRNCLHRLHDDKGFLLLLCALCVPLLMTLAGRFPAYYRWMAFLPLLTSVMSIASRSRLWCSVFSVVTVMLAILWGRSMLSDGHWEYRNMHSFVERQNFKPSDNIVCPFSLFYEIKPVCDTCYFLGIFPEEYLDCVDYVVTADSGDSFDQRIDEYLDKLKADTTIEVAAIDRCENPSLTLYRVQKRYE